MADCPNMHKNDSSVSETELLNASHFAEALGSLEHLSDKQNSTNKSALDAAQKTLERCFPEPILEQGTYLSRITKQGDKFMPAQLFEPANAYEFSDEFKALAPIERFVQYGWTTDLQNDLLNNTVNGIASAGLKGQFGLNIRQWQDARTAFEMAGIAGKLPEFVKALNDRLQAFPFDGKFQIRASHNPACHPWIGQSVDESVVVKIEGGNGEKFMQSLAYAYPFSEEHTREFVSMHLQDRLDKKGWSDALEDQFSKVITDRIHSVEAQNGRFGSSKSEFHDIALCFAIALKEGPDKFESVLSKVNLYEKEHGRPLIEMRQSEKSDSFLGAHEAYTTLILPGQDDSFSTIKLSCPSR